MAEVSFSSLQLEPESKVTAVDFDSPWKCEPREQVGQTLCYLRKGRQVSSNKPRNKLFLCMSFRAIEQLVKFNRNATLPNDNLRKRLCMGLSVSVSDSGTIRVLMR